MAIRLLNSSPLRGRQARVAWRRLLVVVMGLVLLGAGVPATAAAPASAVAEADVRVIVDVSANMGESDPDNVRSRALALLLRLLPDDGRAGVWTYGQYVNMQVKYAPSDDVWKETAAILTSELESVGRRSDLREAIDRASWDRATGGGPAHLVLLTDGHLNVSDDAAVNAADRAHLLEDLVPELAEAGYRVHTLALSERADTALLGQLAALTGGYHGQIEAPDALPEGLLALLGWVASAGTLEVSDRGTFRIAPGTREVTVLTLGGGLGTDLTLVNPGGDRLTPTTPRERVRWHLDPYYQMLTLERPPAGVWRFEGAQQDVRVYAYGDLSMRYPDLPATVFPGALRTFELALTSREGPVVDAAFLELLNVSARLHGADGDVPLVVEPVGGGRFRVNLQGLRGRGDYLLETRLQGPTFSYRLSLPFVLDNPLSVEVHPAADGFVLWAQVGAWEVDHATLRLAAMVRHPPAAAKLFPVQRMPGGLWKLTVPGTRGLMEVFLDFHGNYLNGRDFQMRTEPLRVVLPLTRVQYADMDLEGRPLLGASLPQGQDPVTRPLSETPPPALAPAAAEPVPVVAQEPALPVIVAVLVAAGCVIACLLLWSLLGFHRDGPDLEQAMARLRAVAEIYDPRA